MTNPSNFKIWKVLFCISCIYVLRIRISPDPSAMRCLSSCTLEPAYLFKQSLKDFFFFLIKNTIKQIYNSINSI